MNVLKSMLIAVASLVAMVAVPASAQTMKVVAAVSSAQALGAPDIKVGDTWEYFFHDTSVGRPGCGFAITIKDVSSEKVAGNVSNPSGCSIGFWASATTYDSGMNPLYPGGFYYKALQFPLEVGKTWSQKFELTIGNKTISSSLSGTVVGVEQRTVPAGVFDVVKIVLKTSYLGVAEGTYHFAGSTEDTLWYSPAIKNIVERRYIDFGLNPSPVEVKLHKYSVQ